MTSPIPLHGHPRSLTALSHPPVLHCHPLDLYHMSTGRARWGCQGLLQVQWRVQGQRLLGWRLHQELLCGLLHQGLLLWGLLLLGWQLHQELLRGWHLWEWWGQELRWGLLQWLLSWGLLGLELPQGWWLQGRQGGELLRGLLQGLRLQGLQGLELLPQLLEWCWGLGSLEHFQIQLQEWILWLFWGLHRCQRLQRLQNLVQETVQKILWGRRWLHCLQVLFSFHELIQEWVH